MLIISVRTFLSGLKALPTSVPVSRHCLLLTRSRQYDAGGDSGLLNDVNSPVDSRRGVLPELGVGGGKTLSRKTESRSPKKKRKFL